MSHPYDAGLIAQRTKERESELHERLNAKLEISRAMFEVSQKPAGDTETRVSAENAHTDEGSGQCK